MAASSSTLQRYQQPMWGRMDRALRNCFTGASIIGVAVLVMVFVVPVPPPHEVNIEDVPERIARLILEKPKPLAPPMPERVAVEKPTVEAPPEPAAKPKAPPRRRTSKPRVSPDRGVQGRQKARTEVTQNLAEVTGSLDKVVENLSRALPESQSSSGDDTPRRRRRGIRSGRSSRQISSVGGVSDLSSPDVSSSAIETEGVSVADISDLTVDGDVGSGTPGGSGAGGSGAQSAGGQYRSNESLLGVVRRYAPGIQFCYDNELKKNPGLRGKLVVSLTVLANGQVSEAKIVQDSLGSPEVTRCVLAQIRGWQFPAIEHGVTSFKTPFVFTPPE
jgi:TonB family protein